MEEKCEVTEFISLHRQQINPQPLPKSTLTFAYGSAKYVKMTEEMRGDDNILRTKVLKEINEDFHQADKLNVALDSGILDQLIKCFKEKDDVIRELASSAVRKVANTEKGRVEIVNNELVPIIANLFNDKVVQIRDNAYSALINLTEFVFGVEHVIECDILKTLVDKLVAEKQDSILILILRLMAVLEEGDLATELLLNTPVLTRLNTHLKSSNYEIRQLAAENLGSISFNVRGKEATIDADSIPIIAGMLTDGNEVVRCAATRALASLAQLKEGKVQIYDLDCLNEVIELLYDLDEQTRLNTVQLIAACAEYPPGRQKFKQCLAKLEDMASRYQRQSPLVAEHARRAIDVINWIP